MHKSEVSLSIEKNIPIEIIQNSLSVQDVLFNNLPFLITILIIVATGLITYKSNKSSIDNQNKVSSESLKNDKENKISDFRHQWLQEVRDTASILVQIIYDIKYFSQLNEKLQEQLDKAIKVDSGSEHIKDMMKEYVTSSKSFYYNISEFHKIEAKFNLLFKSEDTESLLLFKHIKSVAEKINTLKIKDIEADVTSKILLELQVILKNEWEVTKNRTWVKTHNKSLQSDP